MNLSCKSKELESLCIEIQDRSSEIKKLDNLSVEVVCVTKFDNERIKKLIPYNPTAYSEENNQIQIKQSKFSIKSRKHKIAILVHEIGEAHRRMNNLPKLKSSFYGELPHDILVDRLVCEWGFSDEIIDERAQSQSRKYADRHQSNLPACRLPAVRHGRQDVSPDKSGRADPRISESHLPPTSRGWDDFPHGIGMGAFAPSSLRFTTRDKSETHPPE